MDEWIDHDEGVRVVRTPNGFDYIPLNQKEPTINATAIKPYTAATCNRIIAACEKELASRPALPPAWRFASEMTFRAGLREVAWCAIAAQDNISGHDELHAALVDLDHYPIWESAT